MRVQLQTNRNQKTPGTDNVYHYEVYRQMANSVFDRISIFLSFSPRLARPSVCEALRRGEQKREQRAWMAEQAARESKEQMRQKLINYCKTENGPTTVCEAKRCGAILALDGAV